MDQPELTPLTKGAITIGEGAAKEKIDLPIGKPIQVHIDHDAAFGKFPKEVTDDKTDETKTIEVNKVIYRFVIDEGDLKGKSFSKTITLSTHERATYRALSLAVVGKVTTDPAELLGQPLQIIAQPWTKYKSPQGERDYQPLTYLPPQEGQVAPEPDVLPTDDEVDAGSEALAAATEVFGKGTTEVK